VLDQHLFHRVLHLLHTGYAGDVFVILQGRNHNIGQLPGRLGAFLAAACGKAFLNRLFNFVGIEGYHATVAFFNGCDHFAFLLIKNGTPGEASA